MLPRNLLRAILLPQSMLLRQFGNCRFTPWRFFSLLRIYQ
jgi:hypothetical protein